MNWASGGYRRFSPDAGWSAPVFLQSEDGGLSDFPSEGRNIAVNDSGDVIVVWSKVFQNEPCVWASRLSAASGRWEDAGIIERKAGFGQYPIYPVVAMDPAGNAVAAWEQHNGIYYSIYANRYVVDAGWGDAGLIENGNSGYEETPALGVDGEGNALVVWSRYDGLRYNVYANRFSIDAGTWASAALMDVAIDQTGNSVVVWTQAMGNINLVTARYSMDAGWSDAGVAESLAYQVDGPKVAFRSDGSWVLVWSQSDGVGDRIWASFCSR